MFSATFFKYAARFIFIIALPLSTTALAQNIVIDLEQSRLEAIDLALRNGWPIRIEQADGSTAEIVGIESGGVLYISTNNANAAISSNAASVRGNAGFLGVIGSGQSVGVWDSAAVRDSHEAFGARITVGDGTSSQSNHSTHVAGTIAASGAFDMSAEGMAPGAMIESFNWSSDTLEMASRGATGANQPNKIKLSNHSYGYVTGWTTYAASGNSGPHWFGNWGEPEDRNFGAYSYGAVSYDNIAFNAPYYLIVKAAGNDRNDSAPNNGDTFYYFDNGSWQSDVYDSNVHPPADGVNTNGFVGYDTLTPRSCCKNTLVVGSMTDAVSGGARSVGAAGINSFSGWGPTDDGRIKPDIVGNGNSLRSTGKNSDSHYYSSTGTSMASPNVCGSAVLLHDLYEQRFPGSSMRAATIKALILHTADDVANPGPDYKTGWGLMNTFAAATVIEDHYAAPLDGHLTEDSLSLQDKEESYLITATGGPLSVTMVWTDPAGAPQSGLDNPTSNLVNDRDIRLVDNTLTPMFPWILDPSNPAADATTGDNFRDNVEQIKLPMGSGDYVLTVSHKGDLTGGSQEFSLIITGGIISQTVQASSFVVGVGGGGLGGQMPTVTSTAPVIGGSFSISGQLAPASAFGIMAYHIGPATPLAIPDNCFLYINLDVAIPTGTMFSDAFGDWAVSAPIPAIPGYEGIVITNQAFFSTTQTSIGWACTPGVQSTLGY